LQFLNKEALSERERGAKNEERWKGGCGRQGKMFKGSVALEGFSSLGIDPRPMVDQI
jgi:hypothetical protein